MNKKQYLESGRIVNTHGIKGEIKIDPWCDSPDFLLDFSKIYIDEKPHTVLSASVHKHMVIMQLEGLSDVNQAMRYKNKVVFIDRNDAKLGEGAWFIQDIIGFTVFDESGTEIGKLKEVLDMPSGDIYVVEGIEEHLVPAVPEFLKQVDTENGRIVVSLIEGCEPVRIDIMTLFPDVVGDMLCESILGRAQERGIIRVECHQIRDHTTNKQKQVDDYPYGGGMGMVMQAQPLHACWQHICNDAGFRVHTILMTPQGKVYRQADAKRLSKLERIILVCGHYEGIDERFIEECVDEEISIGDFVLTGGEIPAMAVADSICRLVPGVLSDESCFTEESHWNGLLEHPHYSRPETWEGKKVPDTLLSGHHVNIKKWRRRESLKRTLVRRPDMLETAELDKNDLKMLIEIKAEIKQSEQ